MSCDLLFEDDPLSIARQNYNGNQLRVDGYYYVGYYANSNYYFNTFFLYRNGTLLNTGAEESGDFIQFETRLQSFNSDFWKNGPKYYWGVFVIDSAEIKFEKWYCAEGVCSAYIRAGKIVNDTTFLITEKYKIVNGKKSKLRESNEIYHFKQYSPKPDSTNNYIQ